MRCASCKRSTIISGVLASSCLNPMPDTFESLLVKLRRAQQTRKDQFLPRNLVPPKSAIMSIEDIQQRIRSFPFTDFVGPVARSVIDQAEQPLRVPLSPEYREFLQHLGSGGVESEEFIGLGGKPHLNVVQMHANLLRKSCPLPTHLILLRGDGFGNYDCLDSACPTENGEFAVVQWFHDGGPNQTHERLASSYFAWFDSILDMIQEQIA
jgi:hypothetical protein